MRFHNLSSYKVYIPGRTEEFAIDEKNNFEIPEELPEEVKAVFKAKLE
jgi:hypothetical protein